MALLTNGKAHPVAATVGAVGGIIAMPFAVAGTAVVGALGTVAVAIPTLGLGAVPGALITVGGVVTAAVGTPFSVGAKIYNGLVPEEDAYYSPVARFTKEIVDEVVDGVGEFVG